MICPKPCFKVTSIEVCYQCPVAWDISLRLVFLNTLSCCDAVSSFSILQFLYNKICFILKGSSSNISFSNFLYNLKFFGPIYFLGKQRPRITFDYKNKQTNKYAEPYLNKRNNQAPSLLENNYAFDFSETIHLRFWKEVQKTKVKDNYYRNIC